MDFSDIEEIIIRSLTGQASKNDLHKLEEWRRLNQENEESYTLLKETWERPSGETYYPAYESLEEHIIEAGYRQQKGAGARSRYSMVFKIAAAVMVIFVTSWLLVTNNHQSEISQKRQDWVVTHNPTGQRSKITLPDNSVIFLNSESQISYLRGFHDSIRHVILEGEAYFEIEHDNDRPFVVEAGGINTTVLGTSFNVRNYPDERSVRVSLLSGRIRVTDSQVPNEVLLEPFEEVDFIKKTRVLKMSRFNRDHITLWKDGIINFKRSSFQHVIRTLERSYDVEIDTADYSTKDWDYTGVFDNTSLEIVLTRIGYSEGFKFEMNGRQVKIHDDRN